MSRGQLPESMEFCSSIGRCRLPFAFFPPPIEDELPYSMLARYQASMNMKHSLQILEQVLGHTHYFPTTAVSNLENMVCVALNNQIPVQEFVQRFTAYNYVTAFLPAEARKSVYSSMIKGGHGNLQRWGHNGTAIHLFMLFCPACVKADLGSSGQAAWRRTHHLPGVFVCSRHGCSLKASNATVRSHKLEACPSDPSVGTALVSPMDASISLKVARLSAELIQSGLPSASSRCLAQAIRELIIESGHATRSGIVDKAFWELVVENASRSESVWGRVNPSRIPIYIAYTWRVQEQRATPLSYILVLATLARSIQDLRTKIDAIGSRKATLCKVPVKVVKVRHEIKFSEKLLEKHRANLLAVLSRNPNAGRSELKSALAVTSFRFLMKFNREWLDQNVSERKRSRFAEMDLVLSSRVSAVANSLYNQPRSPKRVTLSRIAERLISAGYIRRNVPNLPRTMAEIARHLESYIEVAIRRLEYFTLTAMEKNMPLNWPTVYPLIKARPELVSYASRLVDEVGECQSSPGCGDTLTVLKQKLVMLRQEFGFIPRPHEN